MDLPLQIELLSGEDRQPSIALGKGMAKRATGSQQKVKVLVVDDERLLADTTAAILRRAGFEAKAIYDGFSALEMARSFHPDVLLTDIMMPAMNGAELAIAMARISPGTRALLFSGQAGIADILEESKGKGFEFPLLAKPVHPQKLIEGIKGLL